MFELNEKFILTQKLPKYFVYCIETYGVTTLALPVYDTVNKAIDMARAILLYVAHSCDQGCIDL